MDTILESENLFFTSDHHFHHANIIKYSGRPFADVEEMNEVLIQNWNLVINGDDLVYHLGDFSLSRNADEVAKVMSRLNGRIRLLCLPWHHDGGWLSNHGTMTSASGEYVEMLPAIDVIKIPWIKRNNYPLSITLSHYPMAEWEASHYGAWLLHGHSHGAWRDHGKRNVVDVGVDSHNYTPVSFGIICSRMDRIAYTGRSSRGD
jgi:calcineurin-like phosphoesterase family protein